jgi:hypothetical protein
MAHKQQALSQTQGMHVKDFFVWDKQTSIKAYHFGGNCLDKCLVVHMYNLYFYFYFLKDALGILTFEKEIPRLQKKSIQI